MLRTTSEFEGYAIGASDGVIGHVTDVFVDDADWTVRWLVVETGSWLSSRKVLISPMAVGEPDRRAKTLPVSITREQVRQSPDRDTHKPVSRQHEFDLTGYYGYSPYWDDPELWGGESNANPFWAAEARAMAGYPDYGETYVSATASAKPDNADSHLQSTNELTTYRVHASDGNIGHVRDLLVEDHTWAIRYLVVETGHWWHGESVLIPPAWISEVNWDASEFRSARTRQAVSDAPAYDPGKRLDAEAEHSLRDWFSKG